MITQSKCAEATCTNPSGESGFCDTCAHRHVVRMRRELELATVIERKPPARCIETSREAACAVCLRRSELDKQGLCAPCSGAYLKARAVHRVSLSEFAMLTQVGG